MEREERTNDKGKGITGTKAMKAIINYDRKQRIFSDIIPY